MSCLKWFKPPPPEEVSMSDNEVSIMDMPDLVMRKILGNLRFCTIMKLRKVCHAFRNFIDDTKLDYGWTQVNIVVRPSLIRVAIYFSSTNSHIILHYVKYATSSFVKVNGMERRVKFLQEEDFLDVFSRDLRVILRNQRLSSMILEIKKDNFEIVSLLFYWEISNNNFTSITKKNIGWRCCRRNRFKSECEFVEHLRDVNSVPFLKPSVDQFFDCFKTVLKSRGSPIQIEELNIQVMDSRHFMDLACFIDIKHMKSLNIVRVKQDGLKDEQQFLDEIVELDGWECIQELSIKKFNVTIPLEKFLHKSELEIRIPTISMEDVLFLKMKLLTSTVFEIYTIHYDDLKDMDQLFSVLGRFVIDEDEEKHWYYRIPDTKQVLDIGHDDYCNVNLNFSFTRLEISDVPKNAMIY